MIGDRYRDANLVRNPFGSSTEQATDIDAWFVSRGLPDPPQPGSATLVQIIGDKGAGKTTHLRHWRQRSPGPFQYVPRAPYRARWQRPPVAPLVYADEVDRMPRPLRRRWFQRLASTGATAIVGTHIDLGSRANRGGLAVVTHRLAPADRATVAAMLDARLASAAIDSGRDRFAFCDDDVDRIHQAAGRSLREATIVAHTVLAQRLDQRSTVSSARRAARWPAMP